jgi:hypothetical protein
MSRSSLAWLSAAVTLAVATASEVIWLHLPLDGCSLTPAISNGSAVAPLVLAVGGISTATMARIFNRARWIVVILISVLLIALGTILFLLNVETMFWESICLGGF